LLTLSPFLPRPFSAPRSPQDKQGSSYNMNDQVSDDFKYFTASIFSNPLEVVGDFFDGLGELPRMMFRTSPKVVKAPEKKKADKKKPAAGLREVGKAGFINLFGSGPTEL
jgi:hypothetical protein